MDNKPNFYREAKLQWAGSRERISASGRGGAFFLTSLFIELIVEAEEMRSNQKVWWAVLVGAICFAALLFAVFGQDWAIGYVFRR